MKDLASDRRFTVVMSITALLLAWAVVVSPGRSWPGMLSIAALATLLVTGTTLLLMGRTREPAASLAQVLHDVDTEPVAKPANWKGKAIL